MRRHGARRVLGWTPAPVFTNSRSENGRRGREGGGPGGPDETFPRRGGRRRVKPSSSWMAEKLQAAVEGLTTGRIWKRADRVRGPVPGKEFPEYLLLIRSAC